MDNALDNKESRLFHVMENNISYLNKRGLPTCSRASKIFPNVT